MSRVQMLLLRMVESPNDANLLAICCGSLTILSRTEELKQSISRDGISLTIEAMQRHPSVVKLQESACDLLWSLAFNNTSVKESIGKVGGVMTVLAAMRLHTKEAELMKSALGTISNLCQIKDNQNTVGENNGIETIISVIKTYSQDAKVLSMAIDTLASIMVGHTTNCTRVHKQYGIKLLGGILDSNSKSDVLKSGCHALAILSDISGHGIVIANYVKAIKRSMSLYSQYKALQKIGIVVLLRVLNEAKNAAQMIRDGCMELAFHVLESNLDEEETCAAASHILYEISDYAVQNKLDLDIYLLATTPDTLLQVIQTHLSSHSIIRTIFRVFANISKNPSVIDKFINMRVIEVLLKTVLTHSKVADVIDCIVSCICALSSDCTIKDETSLAALLICFRARSENLTLVTQTFAMLYQWVNAHKDMNNLAISGFIGAAIRSLSRFLSQTTLPMVQMKHICLFLYSSTTTQHGCDSVTTCGGVVVYKKLQIRLRGLPYQKQLTEVVSETLKHLMSGPAPIRSASTKNLFTPEVSDVEEEEEEEDNEPDDDSEDSDHCFVEEPQLNTEEPEENEEPEEPKIPSPKQIHLQPATFTVVNEHGVHYPEHPLKHFSRPNVYHEDTPRLNSSSPLHLESCCKMDPLRRVSYVEEATRRRCTFYEKLDTELALVVYDSLTAAGASRRSKLPTPYPYHIPASNPTTERSFGNVPSLTFDSEFESGNLLRAIRIGVYEYDLVLRADLHTSGYMQWFYFAVSNVSENGSCNYRFNIVNLCKPDSLFNHGLQPVVYSVQDAATKNVGWCRSGQNVCYYDNPFTRETLGSSTGEIHRTLSFTLHLPNSKDTYLIAHSYPYTVTEHRIHVGSILADSKNDSILKRRTLCLSLGGLECDLLTITDFKDDLKKKKTVVISSRVHPGEAQASWMMRGAIDFLIGDSHEAKLLRSLYVFRIVPMLNPDGVFYGNNRCGLSACDLNRQWKRPNRSTHPTVSNTKGMIRSEKASGDVLLYCDIHGHSRKMNIFMYGCDSKKKPNPKARVFPKILSENKIGRRYVSFKDCSFHVNKGRESTARVVIGREMNISNSFTLEASFCGSDFGELANTHFSIAQLLDVGRSLCSGLVDYSIPDPKKRASVLSAVSAGSLDIHKAMLQHPSAILETIPKVRKKKKKVVLPYGGGVAFSNGTPISEVQAALVLVNKKSAQVKSGFLPKSVSYSRRIRTACKKNRFLNHELAINFSKPEAKMKGTVVSSRGKRFVQKNQSRASTAAFGNRRSTTTRRSSFDRREEYLPDVFL